MIDYYFITDFYRNYYVNNNISSSTTATTTTTTTKSTTTTITKTTTSSGERWRVVRHSLDWTMCRICLRMTSSNSSCGRRGGCGFIFVIHINFLAEILIIIHIVVRHAADMSLLLFMKMYIIIHGFLLRLLALVQVSPSLPLSLSISHFLSSSPSPPLQPFLSMRAVVAYFGTQHGRRNQIFTLIAVLVVGSSNRKHKCLPQLAGLVQMVLRDADEVQVRNVDRRLKVLRKRVYILLYIVL